MFPLIFFRKFPNRQGTCQKADQVGKHHQAVKHVGHVPHKIHLQGRTGNNEDHNQNRIDLYSLIAEEMADVDLAEIIPAYNSSEGKEQHTDCHEDFSEGSIGRIKSALRQGGSGQAVVPYAGGKNYKGSERKDDKGIDKYA